LDILTQQFVGTQVPGHHHLKFFDAVAGLSRRYNITTEQWYVKYIIGTTFPSRCGTESRSAGMRRGEMPDQTALHHLAAGVTPGQRLKIICGAGSGSATVCAGNTLGFDLGHTIR
jgi:hypothetical protein